MKCFQIKPNESGQRLDKYLKKLLSQAGSSFIYKMLRKKNITLNGKKADGSEKLKVGDEVKLFLSDETFEKFSASLPVSAKIQKTQYPRAALDIVFEDEDILIINKPAGMLSQKARAEDVSANEYIIGYLLATGQLKQEELATFRPSVCNRLDRNTSGLLIAGKSLRGLQQMARQLNSRSMQKYYRCLVKGRVTGTCEIDGWLCKEETLNKVQVSKKELPNSKYIKTAYHPIDFYGNYTLLEVHLITGRSHQIRAHLASIGHPILGDSKYGDQKINRIFAGKMKLHGQLLHAYRMKLADGREFCAPVGREFQQAIRILSDLKN